MHFLLMALFSLAIVTAAVSTGGASRSASEVVARAEVQRIQRAVAEFQQAYTGYRAANSDAAPAQAADLFPAYGFAPAAYAGGRAAYVSGTHSVCFIPVAAAPAVVAAEIGGSVGTASTCPTPTAFAASTPAAYVALN